MAYGHAERNLALIRQLEAETVRLMESLDRPDAKRQAACTRRPRELPPRVPAERGEGSPLTSAAARSE